MIDASMKRMSRMCASDEHARFGATVGVKVVVLAGVMKAYATDGKRLVCVTDKETTLQDGEAIIHAKVWDMVMEHRAALSGITFEGGGVVFRFEDGVELKARSCEGRFPDVHGLLAGKDLSGQDAETVVSVRVNPRHLASVLLLANDCNGVDGGCTLEILAYASGVRMVRVVEANDIECLGLVTVSQNNAD